MLEQEHRNAGMSAEDARRAAQRQLGNVAQAGEDARRISVPLWIETVVQDIRYTVRGYRRNPGFAAAAVLALALGIGANTAIFSLVNAVMLRPLAVREPSELVQIARLTPDDRPGQLSYAMFEHFRGNLRSVSGILAVGTARRTIVIGGEEERVNAELVSGEYFGVLGVDPAAGRLLGPPDDALEPASPAAVISDRYWAARSGRSRGVIGRSITIDDQRFTIVGVTPPSFRSAVRGNAPDIMLPLLATMSEEQRLEPTNHWLHALGRLRPAVGEEQADAEVRVAYSSFLQMQAALAPVDDRGEILRRRATALRAPGGSNPLAVEMSGPLVVLMAIVGLILALICVNLSALLLARAAARQREVAIRLAIGVGRGRLVRQLATESLVLATAGGLFGLVLAYWFSTRLVGLFSDGRDLHLSVTPDARVVAFTCVLSLLTCATASLAPAIRFLRTTEKPTAGELKGQPRRRVEKGIVVVQLAISMVLLVAATLFVGTLAELYEVDPGFDSRGLLVLEVRSIQPYSDERAPLVQEALLERLRGAPEVLAASTVATLPIGGNQWTREVQVEGLALPRGEAESVGFNVIGPGYFATMRTALLLGREFSDRDDGGAPRVAIVNESFARSYFGSESALGRAVTSVDVTYEIVGVVADAKYDDLRDPGLRTMYIPWMQREGEQPSSYHYLLRLGGDDPLQLTAALRPLLHEVDPGLKLESATAYSTIIARSITSERIIGSLAGLFGVLALVVAGLGIFGVLAFQVAQRTRELGLRMALGATPGSLTRLVVGDVGWLLLAGLTIGAGAGLLLSRLAASMVFGFTRDAPAVLAIAAALLTAAALFAGWLPARRAAHVDALIALRQE